MATRKQQRVNPRAAEEQYQRQAQRRAQAGTTGEGQRLSGGQTKAGGSTIKRAQFDPNTGEMLRNADGSPVTVSETQRGYTFGNTEGAERARQDLQNIAGGARVNQAGVQGYQEARQSAELQQNLGGIQSGANGQPGALGFNPVNTTLNNAQQPNAVSEFYAEPDFSSGSYARLSDIDKEAIRTERLNQAAIQERIRTEREQRSQREAAGRAAQQGAQSFAQRRNPASEGRLSSLDALAKGLPPEDAAIIGAYKDAIGAREEAIGTANQLRRDGQQIIEDNFSDEQNLISEMRSRSKQDFDMVEGMLSDQRERVQKRLAEKEEEALNELAFREEKLIREANAQKREMLDKATASLALSGGFGSSNGNAALRDAEREADQAISDLKKEFGFKKTDIISNFKDSYIAAEERYESGYLEAWKVRQEKRDALDSASLMSQQNKRNKKLENDKEWYSTVESLKIQMAEDVKQAAVSVRTMRMELKAQAIERKAEARNNLTEAFSSFPAGSSMRKLAIQEALDAGLDVSGVNINEIGIDQMQKMKDQVQEEMFSPGQFNDARAKNIMRSGLIVTNKLSGEASRSAALAEVRSLLREGNYDEAEQFLKNIAVNELNGGQYDSYIQRKTVIDATTPLLKELKQIQDTPKGKKFVKAISKANEDLNKRINKKGIDGLDASDFNWYKKKLQAARNAIGADSDPELKRIFAKVENVASIIINDRYGAAVTDGEMDRAREYIAMSGNTLGDMIIKLEQYSNFSALQNDQMLGVSVYGSDYDPSTGSSTLPDNLDEQFQEMETFFDDQEGELVSKVYNGRKVTLAPPAARAFESANRDFRRDHGTDITIGGVETSSFRRQEDAIRSMAERAGIAFNEANPNETAAQLRDRGMQVADVGYSMHEKGLAVDLYPYDIGIGDTTYTTSEYIALVKPYLERYGIEQVNHGGRDPGNFEFTRLS